MSVEVARFGMCECAVMHLMPDVCSCHVLRILVVAVCRIGDVCCLPAPAHQPFLFNSLGLCAPVEACSRNVHASGTLKVGYEGIFKMALKSHLFAIFTPKCQETRRCYGCHCITLLPKMISSSLHI